MGYRDNIKVLLMRGKAYKSKGQGVAGGRKMHLPAIAAPRLTGTIRDRAIVDRAISEQMGKLNIGGKVKKASKNFKPLKFNF